METNDLRKAANAIYIAVDKEVADDIAHMLIWAASEIDGLREDLLEAKAKITAFDWEKIQ